MWINLSVDTRLVIQISYTMCAIDSRGLCGSLTKYRHHDTNVLVGMVKHVGDVFDLTVLKYTPECSQGKLDPTSVQDIAYG